MNALAQITRQQSIYFPGYMEQMNETNPEKLEWELKGFQSQFSKKK